MDKIKKYGPIAARKLLGLVYMMAGIAGLLNLIPPPTDLPQPMMDFQTALNSTGYFFQFLKLTEAVFGLMLIVAIAPALSLVVLAPITIQIFLVHLFLTPGIQNLILPIILIGLHTYAATRYWPVYRPLFKRAPVS